MGAAAAETLVIGGAKVHALAASQNEEPARPISANDRIPIALIGAGGKGQGDTRLASRIPGVKVVAASDCYSGRLQRAKELWGDDIFTSRDYREVLARKDIDAIICGTPDHWHKQVSVDAMKAGKDVYCEKPMIHRYSDGPEMIAAARQTNRILQIGSQRVSSIIYAKAKELLDAGAIGELNMVSAWWDRNSAVGAWDYTVPPDASPETCDWTRFLGTAPKIPFDPEQFFCWRKWSAYGSGVAGDLFVHLFSGTNFVTGSHGPTRAMATGGIRFWKDGRNEPDLLLGLFDYPQGFNLTLRVNFENGGQESEGFVFTGSEGTMTIGGNGVSLSHTPLEKAPGLVIGSFPEAMQKEIREQYDKKYPPSFPTGPTYAASERFAAPEGYSDSYDHLKNFFAAVRSRQPVVEDGVFGYRAAGAALLSNLSYQRKEIVRWDPEQMKLLS